MFPSPARISSRNNQSAHTDEPEGLRLFDHFARKLYKRDKLGWIYLNGGCLGKSVGRAGAVRFNRVGRSAADAAAGKRPVWRRGGLLPESQ